VLLCGLSLVQFAKCYLVVVYFGSTRLLLLVDVVCIDTTWLMLYMLIPVRYITGDSKAIYLLKAQ